MKQTSSHDEAQIISELQSHIKQQEIKIQQMSLRESQLIQENALLRKEITSLNDVLKKYQPVSVQTSPNKLFTQSSIDTSFSKTNESTHEIVQRQRKESIMINSHQFGMSISQTGPSQNIFESFFIVGPDLQSVKDASTSKLEKSDTIKLKPKILSSYPYQSCEQQSSNIVNHIFPKGVYSKIQIYRKGDDTSNESINQRIYGQIFLNEKKNLRSVFNTQCQQKSDNEFVLTIFDISQSDILSKNPLIQKSNPNNFLYCICFQFKDFNKGQIEKQRHSSIFGRKHRQQCEEQKIYFNSIVYCFLTYYPFMHFFFDALAFIRNSLKNIRLNNLQNSQMIDLDHEYTIKLVNQDQTITNLLCEIFHFKIQPGIQFEFGKNYFQFTLEMHLPNLDEMKYLEWNWCAYYCFSKLTYQQLLFIFSCIMIELKVTLISTNPCLLTTSLLTFLNILRPFKYPYPICFSLPEDNIDKIACITPFLFGISGTYQEFQSQIQEYITEDSVFFDLDTNTVVFSQELSMGQIENILPFLPIDILTDYLHINSGTQNFQLYNSQKIYKNQKQEILSETQSRSQSSESLSPMTLIRRISEQFENFFNCEIIKYIPKEKYFVRKQQADMKKITTQMKDEHNFVPILSRFLESLTFTYYIQEMYEKKY